ncbi:MAG: TSUP family transporter [Planctomycetota bacterium]
MVSFIAVVVVSILLGLFGGGSLLILSVLVYLVGLSPALATSYSLLIVGVAALNGTFGHLRDGLVNFPSAMGLGVPLGISVFLARMVLLPSIPERLFESASYSLTKNAGTAETVRYHHGGACRRIFDRICRLRRWIFDRSGTDHLSAIPGPRGDRNISVCHCAEITHWIPM